MSSDLNIRRDLSIGPSGTPATPLPASRRGEGPAFKDLLDTARVRQAGELKFSAHARSRMESRQIAIDSAAMGRIEGAVERAASKGARESLVLLDRTAFVVSVPNRTVITVVDPDSLKQNVFTNIDSAVIA